MVTPRTVTLADLRQRVQVRFGGALTEVIDVSDLDDLINVVLGEMHSLLCMTNENWVVETLTLNLTGSAYALPSDHGSTRSVDRITDDGRFIKLLRFEDQSQGIIEPADEETYSGDGALPLWDVSNDVMTFFPQSERPGNVRIRYVPTTPSLASASDVLPRRYTINAWDEFIVCGVTAKVQQQDEGDPTACLADKESIRQRIQSDAPRDVSGTRTMQLIRTGTNRFSRRWPYRRQT